MTIEEDVSAFAAEITRTSGIQCQANWIEIEIELSEKCSILLEATGGWKEPFRMSAMIKHGNNITKTDIEEYAPCTKKEVLNLFSAKSLQQLETEIFAFLASENEGEAESSDVIQTGNGGEDSLLAKLFAVCRVFMTPDGLRGCMLSDGDYLEVDEPRRHLPTKYKAEDLRVVGSKDTLPGLLASYLEKRPLCGKTEVELYHKSVISYGRPPHMLLHAEVYYDGHLVFMITDLFHTYDRKPFDDYILIYTYGDIMPNLEATGEKVTPEMIDQVVRAEMAIHKALELTEDDPIVK